MCHQIMNIFYIITCVILSLILNFLLSYIVIIFRKIFVGMKMKTNLNTVKYVNAIGMANSLIFINITKIVLRRKNF